MQTDLFYIGSHDFEMSFDEKMEILSFIQESQIHRMAQTEYSMINFLGADELSPFYSNSRSITMAGLEVGTFVAGS